LVTVRVAGAHPQPESTAGAEQPQEDSAAGAEHPHEDSAAGAAHPHEEAAPQLLPHDLALRPNRQPRFLPHPLSQLAGAEHPQELAGATLPHPQLGAAGAEHPPHEGVTGTSSVTH